MGQADQIGAGESSGRKHKVHISKTVRRQCFEGPLERAALSGETTVRADLLVGEIRHGHWGEMIAISNLRLL